MEPVTPRMIRLPDRMDMTALYIQQKSDAGCAWLFMV
jgi:hypothetical protein